VRYRSGGFSVTVDHQYPSIVRLQLDALAGESEWTEEETNVYLGAVSDAIRSGSFDGFTLPSGDALLGHWRYRIRLTPTRYRVPDCFFDHQHDFAECYRRNWSLAARYWKQWQGAFNEYLGR
jgi:hypothetical protein